MRPFDELMTSFLAEHQLPGAALAVGRGGRVVYQRGFGYADAETQRVVQPADLFRIASLSKPITAVAILQLVERGKLSLDDEAFGLLGHEKTRDPRMQRITVRQLLQHTGGFDREASFDPMFRSVEIAAALGRQAPATSRDVIESMLDRPLDFDPGERYAYSNFGYCVLGRIVEKVTGRDYDAHVAREVFRPLGIRGACIGRTRLEGRRRNEVRYRAEGFGKSVFAADLGDPLPRPYGAWHLEAMDAHGGWIASAPDLVRFASDLDDPARSKLLSAASIETMFARPAGRAGLDDEGRPKVPHYGCGWMVRPAGQGGRNTWHTGSLDGTSTLLVRRHDGLTWAVLFNTRDTPAGERVSAAIDPLLHAAADAIRAWPEP
jgi:CubicO group peptidase (beta-lactamase class C family)